MRKYKYFIDFDKEESWLRKMAKQGYQLMKKTSLGYQFQLGKPEDSIIKVDYRLFKKQADFLDYITLFEDSGWKHIAGSKSSGTQYFKKTSEDSEDDIFSDKASKAGKYKRLSSMFIQMAFIYLPIFIALLNTNAIDINALVNPKHFYLTPGLWEMSGSVFWNAFLFETPFALFRGLAWLFFPAFIIFYLFFAYKAQKLYEKNKNE